MNNILIIYSTCDGHTEKICHKIRELCEGYGHEVKLVSITELSPEDLHRFAKIVIGASIRYGKHNQKIIDFVMNNRALLDSKPSAFFSVNLVARKPNKNTPETNPYLKKFLRRVSWRPARTTVFAGSIDYKKYRFSDRTIIRIIMFLTKGPTHPDAAVDYTNWEEVEKFAGVVHEM
ncbi:MAG: menaquinone-dependent protoporphyrinogen IX dehydrogenase [Gammaproteobacteria bacterium]|nr:menaquinone-dependent protoporphyrinogen IX dehydrogenase [Gammaproteobacteria bacterium]